MALTSAYVFGSSQVSWIRKQDLHILTLDGYSYTTDERFKVRSLEKMAIAHHFYTSCLCFNVAACFEILTWFTWCWKNSWKGLQLIEVTVSAVQQPAKSRMSCDARSYPSPHHGLRPPKTCRFHKYFKTNPLPIPQYPEKQAENVSVGYWKRPQPSKSSLKSNHHHH